LQPLLQQVDVDYLNVCHELTATPVRNLTDHPIGAMLYALIVSPDVEVNALSKAEIQEICDGRVSNWAQVGGSNEAITVVLPPAGSSINAIFQSYVLNNGVEHVGAKRINKDSPAMVVQSILQTPGAISFVPLVIAQKAGMKIITIDGVAPSVQTLLQGTYEFWSVEHCYTQNDGSASSY
jgi:phosphate transport system substrate-binding protein